MGLPLEGMILAGAAIYASIRFGLTWLLDHYAHQRGMFHSLPAAAVAGQVTFLAYGSEEPLRRYFVCSAVVLGFLSHLILDEIWAVRMGWFGPKVKKSFGTALKLNGPDLWPNLLTYALALVLGGLAAADASWTERSANMRQHMEHATRTYQQPMPPQYQQYQQPPQWQLRR